MKTNLFTIMTLLVFTSLFSQSSTNYLDETSEWRNYRGSWGDINYDTYYLDGTAVFNGLTYYQFFRNEHKIATNIYFGGTTITDTTYGPGYLRENNGQFLFYNSSNNSESLWFDNQILMNSQIGDLYSFQSALCTIQSISTNYLGSIGLKRITGLNTTGSTGAIEGIGEIGAVCSAGIESSSFLCCYSKQGNSIQFGDINCNLFNNPVRVNLSNTILNDVNIKVYPNPTTGVLNIQLQDKLSQTFYTVYDIRGMKIQEGYLNETNQIINFTNFQKGLYIVKMKNENTEIIRKIIKE